VSLFQLANQFFLGFFADLQAKRSVETLSPYESLPARLGAMKVTSPTAAQPVHLQMIPARRQQTDEVSLIIP
jgi:hypothetical protein